ncbi:hypothetical protein KIN20_034590 [Parelaphostrongylus tenuis]|uniref:Uncharacterized protein n=1 Tax=Parelaphostrongylus tenuis TaxID=148309 RepID=A0AAD5WJS3_PARTN|nr:hypothetical protein KIN20_034590 [Parelaphostrongylus tenuis]
MIINELAKTNTTLLCPVSPASRFEEVCSDSFRRSTFKDVYKTKMGRLCDYKAQNIPSVELEWNPENSTVSNQFTTQQKCAHENELMMN